jgi:hypothetical protein
MLTALSARSGRGRAPFAALTTPCWAEPSAAGWAARRRRSRSSQTSGSSSPAPVPSVPSSAAGTGAVCGTARAVPPRPAMSAGRSNVCMRVPTPAGTHAAIPMYLCGAADAGSRGQRGRRGRRWQRLLKRWRLLRGGWSATTLTADHSPDVPGELARIAACGGEVWRTGGSRGPWAVFGPGQDGPGLPLSRSSPHSIN